MNLEPIKKLYLTDTDATLNNLYISFKRGEMTKADFCMRCEKLGFHPYLVAERFKPLNDIHKMNGDQCGNI